jgi:hypothetical protein
MACETSITIARTQLTIAFQNALRQTGEKFLALAKTLLEESVDARTRGNVLFGEEGRAVWAGMFNSDAAILRGALDQFEAIVGDTANGGTVTEQLYMQSGSWEGENDPNKLENLRGTWAEVVKYLEIAGFKLTVVPVNLGCFKLQITR